jgi:hypothetical protein
MILYAPQSIATRDHTKPSVFLAGSIEMGKAVDWQTSTAQTLVNRGFNVFNPRRKDWDSSWEQKFENAQFNQQVTWELNALTHADYIIMYFAPDTKSPISLLELGKFGSEDKGMVVVCPDTFCRKGNVDVFCNFYNIAMKETIEQAIDLITDHRDNN